jgi:hypothetical protein
MKSRSSRDSFRPTAALLGNLDRSGIHQTVLFSYATAIAGTKIKSWQDGAHSG